MKKTYSEKLKDPRWQRRRLEMLTKAEWTCELCCESDLTLHVHHKAYFKGREPWEYDDDQLAVLCELCHRDVSQGPDLLDEVVSRLPIDGPYGRRDVAIVLAALFFPGLKLTDEFSIDALQCLRVDGGGSALRDKWDEVWWTTIHKLASNRSNK